MDDSGVGLYDPIYMARYHSRVSGRLLEGLTPDRQRVLALAPHVYEVAEAAHRALVSERLSRSIVLLGDSGSGKSELFKQMMQFLLCIQPLEAQGVTPEAAVVTVTSGGAQASKGAVAAGIPVPEATPLLQAAFSGVAPTTAASGAHRQRAGASAASASPSLSMAGSAVSRSGAANFQPSHPLVESARRDAERRRGPLGTVRNPWVTLTQYAGDREQRDASAASASAMAASDFFVEDAPAPSARGSGSLAISGAGSGLLGDGQRPLRLLAAAIPPYARVIMAASTVLEAFGCAAVQGSPNSSRFARSVKLFCDSATGAVVGGQLDAVLLEPRRVLGAAFDARAFLSTSSGALAAGGGGTGSSRDATSSSGAGVSGPEGRNFHIFYQLLAGATRDVRAAAHLGGQADYLCLYQTAQGAGVGAGLGTGTGVSSVPSSNAFLSALGTSSALQPYSSGAADAISY